MTTCVNEFEAGEPGGYGQTKRVSGLGLGAWHTIIVSIEALEDNKSKLTIYIDGKEVSRGEPFIDTVIDPDKHNQWTVGNQDRWLFTGLMRPICAFMGSHGPDQISDLIDRAVTSYVASNLLAIPPQAKGINTKKPEFPEVDPMASTCVDRDSPIILESWSQVKINPTDCLNKSPKVALVYHGNLPPALRNQLTGYSHQTPMLLYVAPSDAVGNRVARLHGDPSCVVDDCTVECHRPTHEKCGVPDPRACASRLDLPDGQTLTLAPLHYTHGVIVVANEIEVSGRVRTNGNDLILLAQTIRAAEGAVIDATPPRKDIDEAPAGGGQIVLMAGVLIGADLHLVSYGAPGGLPKTTRDGVGLHWDCRDYTNDAAKYGNMWPTHFNPRCFPCMTPIGELCSNEERRFTVGTFLEPRRLTSIKEQGGTWIYHFDYPSTAPALPTLPLRFYQRAPDDAVFEDSVFELRTVNLEDPAINVEHPESLRKAWRLSVRVCQPWESPSLECATAAELQAIERLQVELALRYKN